MTTFTEYQLRASEFAAYPGADQPLPMVPPGLYPAMGLNGEAGEVAEKLKKLWRDGTPDLGTFQADLTKELGDVLWYVSETARQWGIPLETVARANIDKLASRKERNVIHGSGDNR